MRSASRRTPMTAVTALFAALALAVMMLVATPTSAEGSDLPSTSAIINLGDVNAQDIAISCARDLRSVASHDWDYSNGSVASALIYGNAGACGANVSRLDTRAWVQLTCLGDPLNNPRRAFDSAFAAGTNGSVANAFVGPFNSITCPVGSPVHFQTEVVVTLNNGQQPTLCVQYNGLLGGPINELSRSTAGCPGF